MSLRGHGSVTAAQSVRHVVFRAIYTVDLPWELWERRAMETQR